MDVKGVILWCLMYVLWNMFPHKILMAKYHTLLATNISFFQDTFEDDFPFPVVGYVSYLKGIEITYFGRNIFSPRFCLGRNPLNPIPRRCWKATDGNGELVGRLKLKRKSHEVQNTPSPCVCWSPCVCVCIPPLKTNMTFEDAFPIEKWWFWNVMLVFRGVNYLYRVVALLWTKAGSLKVNWFHWHWNHQTLVRTLAILKLFGSD